MTRADLRLVFAIVTTSMLSSATATLCLHQTPTMPEPVDLAPLEQRMATLEALEKPEAPPPAPESSCDEVSCVLDDYDRPCCARFLRDLPESLDREIISEGVAAMRSSIVACGDHTRATGTVKLHVMVNADGTVARVKVVVAPDHKLAACVAETMQLATFTPTRHGGSFSYPFIF